MRRRRATWTRCEPDVTTVTSASQDCDKARSGGRVRSALAQLDIDPPAHRAAAPVDDDRRDHLLQPLLPLGHSLVPVVCSARLFEARRSSRRVVRN